MSFKPFGIVFGGSLLIVIATVVPGAAIGLPLLGASGVLTWFGGIAGGTVGGAMGAVGGAVLDERERRRDDQLADKDGKRRLDDISEASVLCLAKILVAAATCDAPITPPERNAIRDLMFAASQLFQSKQKRDTLDSLLTSHVSRADAANEYHLLAPWGQSVQRFTLELVNAVLFADTKPEEQHLNPEEREFLAYWATLTSGVAREAARGESTHGNV